MHDLHAGEEVRRFFVFRLFFLRYGKAYPRRVFRAVVHGFFLKKTQKKAPERDVPGPECVRFD